MTVELFHRTRRLPEVAEECPFSHVRNFYKNIISPLLFLESIHLKSKAIVPADNSQYGESCLNGKCSQSRSRSCLLGEQSH